MKNNQKNREIKSYGSEGISLISLIITVIVIIILAAIVIFTGLNTPDSAQFANFTQQVDNVQMAVTNKFAELKTKHSIEGRYRTDEQIYLEIATGVDNGMDKFMCTVGTSYKATSEESTGIQNITVGGAKNKEHSIAMTLPKVRESNTAWYVTKEGRVFNANGYTYNDKTYFTGGIYQEGTLPAQDTMQEGNAEEIYLAIKNGTNIVENATGTGGSTGGIDNIVASNWTYNHSTQTVTNGTLVLNIGDYVNDTGTQTVSGFDGKWRVLGAEDGQLLLVTATYYSPFDATAAGIDSSDKVQVGPSDLGLKLTGVDGWNNGISKMNSIGAQYNNDKLEKGRSLKVEDINRITGYSPTESRLNPNDLTVKGPYGNGYIYQYGNNATYTIKSDEKVWYKGDQAATTETQSTYTKFWKLGESSNITEPFTIQSTCYLYYPETLGNFQTSSVASGQTMEGISSSSSAYDMLFKAPYSPYWLASPCVVAGAGYVDWDFFSVPSSGSVSSIGVWNSYFGSDSRACGVRAAVSLKSNIQLTPAESTNGIPTYTF